MTTDQQIYDKRADETAVAYRAFQDYLLMKKRSLSELKAHYEKDGDAPTHSRNTLKNWQMRHQWIPRAEAWDAAQGALRVAAAGEELRRQEVIEIERYCKIHRDLGVAGTQLSMMILASMTEYVRDGRVVKGKLQIESLNGLGKAAGIVAKISPPSSEVWAKAIQLDEILTAWHDARGDEAG